MDALSQLKNDILQSSSALVQPRALAHSQELEEQLPLVRRYVGPRAWYQCVEASHPAEKPA